MRRPRGTAAVAAVLVLLGAPACGTKVHVAAEPVGDGARAPDDPDLH